MSKCKIQAGDRITMRQGVAFYDCRVTHACKDRLEVEEELSFAQAWSEKTKGVIIDRLKWTIEIVHQPKLPKKAKKTYFMDYFWTTVIALAGMSTGYLLAYLLYKLFN